MDYIKSARGLAKSENMAANQRAASRQEEELPGTVSDLTRKADQREGPERLADLLSTGEYLGCPWVIFVSGELQQASLNVDASLPFKAGRWLQRKQAFQEVKERISYTGKASVSTLRNVFTQRPGLLTLEFCCHIS